MIKNYLATLLILLLIGSINGQSSLNLVPSKDNSIYQDQTSNSNGIGKLFAGQTCGNSARRALMKFDLSSLPTGATIDSVTLTMNVEQTGSNASLGQVHNIYALSKNFGEGTSLGLGQGALAIAPDATWLAAQTGSVNWTNPGGDLSPLPISTTTMGGVGNYTFPNTNIFKSLVNAWVNTPSNNFGIILIGAASPSCTARRFGSKDQGVAPVLTIYYTPCQASSSTDTRTACDSFTWIDGNTYTTNNTTAKDTLINAVGCDSIVTLNLSLNNSSSSTDTRTACDSFLWIDGNTYNSSNSTATFTLSNANGCDSIVTLNLTLNNSTTGTDVRSACSSLTWIDGNTYTSPNNTATFTSTNANGCDSIITLNFSLSNVSTGTDTRVACDSFTWTNGITYTASNTTARDTFPLGGGCDSIVTLNLSLLNSTTATDVQTACGSFSWIDGNTYNSSNNTATFTLTNSQGCDSVVSLDLSIPAIDVSTSVADDVISANATGASYQWIDCTNGNAEINGETSQLFTAPDNGSYAVIVSQNNCSDTSACVNTSNVGIADPAILQEVSFYPNPSTGKVQFKFGQLENLSLRVYNTLSQVVFEEKSIPSSSYDLELPEEVGLYVVEVRAQNKAAFFKLVKQ